MNELAVAFTGPSNSGKTTIITKIADKLTKKYNLAIVKHDPSDKAKFDKEGKDSWKFSQTGADVVVLSPTRTTYFSQKPKEIEDIIKLLKPFDLLIVEGLKTLPLVRIGVFRNEIDVEYFPYCNAIAIDGSIDLGKYTLPNELDVLNLNDEDEIINWIKNNAKRV